MQSQDVVSKVVINLSEITQGTLVDKRKIMVGYQEVKELFDLRGDDSEPVMVMVNVGTKVREHPHFQTQLTSSVGIVTANSLAAGKMMTAYISFEGQQQPMGHQVGPHPLVQQHMGYPYAPQAFHQVSPEAAFENFILNWKAMRSTFGRNMNAGWS